jgi:hypothetical protein
MVFTASHNFGLEGLVIDPKIRIDHQQMRSIPKQRHRGEPNVEISCTKA